MTTQSVSHMSMKDAMSCVCLFLSAAHIQFYRFSFLDYSRVKVQAFYRQMFLSLNRWVVLRTESVHPDGCPNWCRTSDFPPAVEWTGQTSTRRLQTARRQSRRKATSILDCSSMENVGVGPQLKTPSTNPALQINAPPGLEGVSRILCTSWKKASTIFIRLTRSLPESSKSTFSQTFKKKCISEVVRIGGMVIFHSKLWKAKFFILCDVIFMLRLQGKFDINGSWKWKGSHEYGESKPFARRWFSRLRARLMDVWPCCPLLAR